MSGYYYLHTNGDLIWKKFRPEDDSTFVKKIWPIDLKDRLCAWNILIDAISMGARTERIKELAAKWQCTKEDFLIYLIEMHKKVDKISGQKAKGADRFIEKILGYNADNFWDWLAATPKGEKPDWNKLCTQ